MGWPWSRNITTARLEARLTTSGTLTADNGNSNWSDTVELGTAKCANRKLQVC